MIDLTYIELLLKEMKKGINNFVAQRHPVSNKEQNQDHFTYFEHLEQKLLHESDKLTNLIGIKGLTSCDTHSLQDSTSIKSKNLDMHSRQLIDSLNFGQAPEHNTKGSLLIQNYLQNKKKLLLSSKSQHFPTQNDKQSQMQRKLAYNMDRPEEQISIPQSNSPSKSDNRFESLKMTSSTTSSVGFMRTLNKIKRMNSKTSLFQLQSGENHTKHISMDDFQILKYLEEGQFGTVYLSRHKATNFICALKKIPKRIFEGEQKYINQLIRQIKIQSYMDHPNIVQLYSFFSDQENLYLIMQVCCSGNVYNSLRSDGRFSQEKVRNIMKQVCHAIEFMHDSDIIHRDIKPENILYHENIVKVCDFGWSIHSPLLRETRCGTPLYSPPEVVQKQQYDNKIDIWNIGILTYELIYGRVPFEIRTEDDLLKVVDEDIYFSKGIPISSEVKDFILSCLQKNPKDRLSMPKLVDHPFLQKSHQQNQ